MRQEYTAGSVTWTDLAAPSVPERASLQRDFDLPVSLMEMLETDAVRPSVRHFNGYTLVTLFIAEESSDNTASRQLQRLDCVVADELLITLHQGNLDSLHGFEKTFEAASLREKGLRDGWQAWYQLMQHVYRRTADELDELTATMERVEEKLYSGDEDRMVSVIARLNRSLLIHRRSLYLHDFIFSRLLDESKHKRIPAEVTHEIVYLQAEHEHLLRILETTKMTMDEVRESGQLMLTNRTNRFMMILTIIAFTTIPVSIAAEFSTIGLRLPFVDTQEGKLVLLLIAFIFAVLLLVWFKHKRWIW